MQAFPRGQEHKPLDAASRPKKSRHNRDNDVLFTSTGVKTDDEPSELTPTTTHNTKQKKARTMKKWGEMKRSRKLEAAKAKRDTSNSLEKASVLTFSVWLLVERLRFKGITEGMSVLGTVRAIQGLEVIVQLPNNLVGHLKISEISDTLTAELKKRTEEVKRLKQEIIFPGRHSFPFFLFWNWPVDFRYSYFGSCHSYKIYWTVDTWERDKQRNLGCEKTCFCLW